MTDETYETITLEEFFENTLTKKFVQMPRDICTSLCCSNRLMELVMDVMRQAMEKYKTVVNKNESK